MFEVGNANRRVSFMVATKVADCLQIFKLTLRLLFIFAAAFDKRSKLMRVWLLFSLFIRF
jgi:hypothetical protein